MEHINKQMLATEIIQQGYSAEEIEKIVEGLISYKMSNFITHKTARNLHCLGKFLHIIKEIDDTNIGDWPKSVLIDLLMGRGEEEMRKYFTLLLKYAEQEPENE